MNEQYKVSHRNLKAAKVDTWINFILAIALGLFIISSTIISHEIWHSSLKSASLFDPNYEMLGSEFSIFPWFTDSGEPIQYELVDNPDTPKQKVMRIKRPASKGWCGIGKPILQNEPFIISDTLILNIKNEGAQVKFYFNIAEQEVPENPVPEVWEKEYSLNDNKWHTIEIPLSSLYLKPYYQPKGKIGNKEFDLNHLLQFQIDFSPDEEINLLIGSITVKKSSFSWTLISSLIVNLIWLIFLSQHAWRNLISRSNTGFLVEIAKFCAYQFVIIFTANHLLYGFSLNLLLGFSLLESIRWLSAPQKDYVSKVLLFCSPIIANLIVLHWASQWPMISLVTASHCFAIISKKESRGLEWSLTVCISILMLNFLVIGTKINPIAACTGLASFFGLYFMIQEQKKYLGHELEQQNRQTLFEQQVQHMQKMEAIGHVTRGIAHEFNNLLTGILGNLKLMKHTKTQNHTAYIDNALESADRAAELIKRLQMFSSLSKIKRQPLELNPLIEDTRKSFEQGLDEHIYITSSVQENLPTIQADPLRIKSVLYNLLINARDAIESSVQNSSTKSDTIHIDVRIAGRTMQEFSKLKTGRYITISITDNGEGMDAQTKAHIFDPFFSTKETGLGTGLGLASAYGIIKDHQGWIEVESAPNEGTTFRIFLPLDPSNAPLVTE